jgi:hypothetical protein
LGGGLATASANVTGLDAMIFNAAGVHAATVERYGFDLASDRELVQHFIVSGEFLTTAQDSRIPGITNSRGNVYMLPRVPVPHTVAPPVKRHGMDAVLRGIEAEIRRLEWKIKFLPAWEK